MFGATICLVEEVPDVVFGQEPRHLLSCLLWLRYPHLAFSESSERAIFVDGSETYDDDV